MTDRTYTDKNGNTWELHIPDNVTYLQLKTEDSERADRLAAAIRDALDLMRADGVLTNVDGQPTAYAALLANAVGVDLDGGGGTS